MIYIKVENYKYNLDIYELVRVFFPNDELVPIESIDEFKEGYLLDLNLETRDNKLYGISKLYHNDKLLSNASVDIDSININRPRDKTIKNGLKKSIYEALIKLTDKSVPWGILTGIRPTKIVHELMEKSTPKEDIFNILTKEYKVNEEKSKLIIDVSNKQEKYIYPIDKDKYSLYIGIPFCPSRCIYCSFTSYPVGKFSGIIDEYVDKLIYEIKCISNMMRNKRINTVYIGGGTPTSIPSDSLKRIIMAVNEYFGRENIKEFTVEAGRPDTIDEKTLIMLKSQKINRISINPQTMNDSTLKTIGRNHTSEDIINAYNLAKSIGIENINMDLIVGLPGEGVEEIKNTLDKIKDLNPENLTVHTLAVKRGSIYKDHMKEYNLEDQSIIQAMLNETKYFADKNDLEPYYLYRQKHIVGNFENIGYAKIGHECIYNISIMEERESIIGAGVGSTTKIYYPDENRLERIFNFKDFKEYVTRIDELVEKKQKIIS